MAIKKRIIPFWMLPASWGLVGIPHQEAKAYYELDGEHLERRLSDIRMPDGGDDHERAQLIIDHKYGHLSDYDFDMQIAGVGQPNDKPKPEDVLTIDYKYGKIDQWTHDTKQAELMFPADSMELQEALLSADYRSGEITKIEYDKTLATARGEPWVGFVDDGFNAEEGLNGLYFELDWNDAWIDFLRKNGYQGFNDDQVVEQWFADVCRAQAEQSPPDDTSPVPFNSARVNRRRNDDGTTEVS